MDSDLLKRFKVLLEKERKRILDNSVQLLKNLPEHIAHTSGDEGDEAQAFFETDMAFRMKDRESNVLDKIAQALERIKEGTFGTCEECEEEIGLKRLETRPIANLCIGCKELEERFERNFATD